MNGPIAGDDLRKLQHIVGVELMILIASDQSAVDLGMAPGV